MPLFDVLVSLQTKITKPVRISSKLERWTQEEGYKEQGGNERSLKIEPKSANHFLLTLLRLHRFLCQAYQLQDGTVDLLLLFSRGTAVFVPDLVD